MQVIQNTQMATDYSQMIWFFIYSVTNKHFVVTVHRVIREFTLDSLVSFGFKSLYFKDSVVQYLNMTYLPGQNAF